MNTSSIHSPDFIMNQLAERCRPVGFDSEPLQDIMERWESFTSTLGFSDIPLFFFLLENLELFDGCELSSDEYLIALIADCIRASASCDIQAFARYVLRSDFPERHFALVVEIISDIPRDDSVVLLGAMMGKLSLEDDSSIISIFAALAHTGNSKALKIIDEILTNYKVSDFVRQEALRYIHELSRNLESIP